MLRKLLLVLALAVCASAQDRRSICLLLDLRSMTSDEATRARANAIGFVEKNMTATDTVSVMTLGTELKVLQETTGDREAVLAALRKVDPSAATGESQKGPFEPIRAAAAALEAQAGKKQLLYYSAASPSAASDEREAAIKAAYRAEVALYAIDARR